jgi:hypothetical protein
MKALKFLSVAAVIAMMSTGMGFPTDITGKGKGNTRKSTCRTEVQTEVQVQEPEEQVQEPEVAMVYRASDDPFMLAMNVAEEVPAEDGLVPVMPSTAPEVITLKVFNVKGQLVMSRQVNIGDFLARSSTAYLPQGITFVMFHDQTAYYFLEEADVL